MGCGCGKKRTVKTPPLQNKPKTGADSDKGRQKK